MALDQGWIYLNYGEAGVFQIRCDKWTWDWIDEVTYLDFAGDSHFGFSIQTYKRTVNIKGIWFDSQDDYETFLGNMDTLQATNSSYKLRIKTTSTPRYHKWNGTYYDMPVVFGQMREIGKSYRGDSEVWEIGMLVLKQSGQLSGT